MAALLLYMLWTTTWYYLGSRAIVTRWLWSRYPAWLDGYMLCAACSGFAYGVIAGGIGWWLQLPFLGLDPRHWWTPLAVGLGSCCWTPILASRHIAALEYLTSGDDGGQKESAG